MEASVSIIVPVYNQEKYLGQCIESIVRQTYSNFECILVDDGSTDNSPRICDEFAKKDSRIKVIHKANQGVSSARKDGYELATSEYICFVDSDDFLADDFVKVMIEKMIETGSDVCSCSHFQYDNGNVITNTYEFPSLVIDKQQILDEYLLPIIGKIYADGYKNYPGYIWGKMYRRSLISCDCFPSERDFFPEDDLFHLYISKKINKAVFISDKLVYYRVNETSFTHAYRKNIWQLCKNRHLRIVEFFNDNMDSRIQKRVSASGFFSVYVTLRNAYESGGYISFKKELKEMIGDDTFKPILLELDNKLLRPRQKVMVVLLRFRCYFFLYHVKNILFRK